MHSYEGKEGGKKEKKEKEGKGPFIPEETSKDKTGKYKNDSHRQKDGTSPHPRDKIESCGKGTENGAEGRESIDFSNDISCLLKIVEGQFDHDRRDHSKEAGWEEEDDGSDEQDPCHESGVKLCPPHQIREGRNSKCPQAGKEEEPAERRGPRIPIRNPASEIGSNADARKNHPDDACPGIKGNTDIGRHDPPCNQFNDQCAKTGNKDDDIRFDHFTLHDLSFFRKGHPVRNSSGGSNSIGIIPGLEPAAERRRIISNGVNTL